ncbi:asparagine synthase [Clostridium sp. D2Q-11]|uniref:Asparagine synthase n=1 Tax=Anaeromonas frigoriresistens TaxID=2683708 RepID=A0A942ZA84_9FIRM|nr:asparagine synthase [Anaeromonas frigoriresistens]MBS4539555.1 asparagine synthase [Anaeromonas frigoriresistens]
MTVKEGTIPTALGAVVTTAGLMSKRSTRKNLAWGIVGFGLAHIVLGGIDLVQHRNDGSIIDNE